MPPSIRLIAASVATPTAGSVGPYIRPSWVIGPGWIRWAPVCGGSGLTPAWIMTWGMSKNIAVSVTRPFSTRLNSTKRIMTIRPVGGMPSQGRSSRPMKWPIWVTQVEAWPSISLRPARKMSGRRCSRVNAVISGAQNSSATASGPCWMWNGCMPRHSQSSDTNGRQARRPRCPARRPRSPGACRGRGLFRVGSRSCHRSRWWKDQGSASTRPGPALRPSSAALVSAWLAGEMLMPL